MQTEQRLTQAYNSAKVQYFDENSKYVFFSDVHRGVGNLSDDFTRNRIIYLYALEHYYKNGFTYVEAGDGDELWENSSFEKNKLAHYEVYLTIKKFFDQDRLFMLYGNHNIHLRNPEFLEKNYGCYYNEYYCENFDFLKGLEVSEALLLKNRKTGQEILTVHGHQGDLTNDQLWWISMFSMKYFWRFFHSLGVQNPASPVKNVNKQHRLERHFKKWIEKSKVMLICGHTHRFKFPRPDETPYFNTGSCVYPATITDIEIENGNITLVRWQVFANEEGFLQISKTILGGPEPLEKFDIR
ncbi:MAG: serine/threonine protein phosphatase [Clostridia bacterium]|nr:serine/threonine protein phosphatase [Clostridia bacterium]